MSAEKFEKEAHRAVHYGDIADGASPDVHTVAFAHFFSSFFAP